MCKTNSVFHAQNELTDSTETSTDSANVKFILKLKQKNKIKKKS